MSNANELKYSKRIVKHHDGVGYCLMWAPYKATALGQRIVEVDLHSFDVDTLEDTDQLVREAIVINSRFRVKRVREEVFNFIRMRKPELISIFEE